MTDFSIADVTTNQSRRSGRTGSCILFGLMLLLLPLTGVATTAEPPNIIFVILDDVGIDHMQIYGNGGLFPPSTPSIDTIADQGVKFSNVWAMPECSPSRSAFFTGRFGLRTGVTSAIIPNMLPQAQVSPYETTLPRLLRTAGYTSAMLGKYHLGSTNPSGKCSPATRGFDFFDGNMAPGPPSIDTKAGFSETAVNTYDCGFARGADPLMASVFGACYFKDNSCQENMTGKTCMQAGGLLDANESCAAQTPDDLDFERANGYYVWPNSITVGSLPAPSGCTATGTGCADLSCPLSPDSEPELSREYMSNAQTLGAVDWWREQEGPRMLTVSYNSIHTPFQPPPTSSDDDPVDTLICQGDNASRGDNLALSNAMLENMDQQIAQLLASLGLATLDDQGNVSTLHLDAMNTMLVIIGDNGTFGPVVRLPFDPFLAKGSVFQTGVWVPLIVAGPLVDGKGRDVPAMVNAVDLFELFAEFAGLDPRAIVPPAHRLDSQPMLHYLSENDTQSGRSFNYTELIGENTLAIPVDPETRFWPCVLQGTVSEDGGNTLVSGGFCVDLLFDNQSLCEDNGGDWFGPETIYHTPANPDQPWDSCCAVHTAFSDPDDVMRLAPLSQRAVQNGKFKLVEADFTNCEEEDPGQFPPFARITGNEFFDLDTIPVDYLRTEVCRTIDRLTLDSPMKCNDGKTSAALPDGISCANAPQCLRTRPRLAEAFGELQSRLNGVTHSAISCDGDGNLDKRVTQLDIDGVLNFMGTGPSYFDFNKDGQTDDTDLAIARANLGMDCLGACRRADLDGNNRVTEEDADLLRNTFGACDPGLASDQRLCAGDLDGDGLIGDKDLQQLNATRQATDGLACPITVVALIDPEPSTAALNVQAIQTAIDTAALDPNGGRVQLEGVFDLGDCSFCVTIHGPVIIEGSADPSAEANPAPGAATIITTTGVSPFVISDQSSGDGVIHIERLWFKGGRGLALNITKLRGRLELMNNRVTGYSSITVNDMELRFGFGIAGVIPGSGDLTGEFHASGNHIDNRDVPFEAGDDNGIAIQGCDFSRIDIVGNRLHTRGESIEVEDCTNPAAIINIADNDVVTDAAISTMAPLTQAVGLDEIGGHPAAIKVAGGQASSLSILNNKVNLSGASTAVCIMPGLTNPDAVILIQGNHCSLSGQFAALLAGWAGTLPSFPPFFLQNATVKNNSFEGSSYLGIAFVDFLFYAGPGPDEGNDLINQGNHNKFFRNNLSGLSTSRAALFFGSNTHDNVFRGDPGGAVEDHGVNNTVIGSRRTPDRRR